MSYNMFLVLILVIAVFLILIIMVQNPKGGGLSSSFGGGAQSLGGVQKTTSFLDKATWTLAIALFTLILLSNFSIQRRHSSDINLDNSLEDVNVKPESNDDTSLPASTDLRNQ